MIFGVRKMNLLSKEFLKKNDIHWILSNKTTGKSSKLKIWCKCGLCGLEKWVYFQNIKWLKSTRCHTCGNTRHNLSSSRIYRIWICMRARCNNQKNSGYKDYGGRGIKICSTWYDFETFYTWAMNNGYSDKLSIDRINNNGNYSPKNCRWATHKEQARNKRSNVVIDGIVITDWAKLLGVSNYCLISRIKTHGLSNKILKPKRKEFSKFPGVSFDKSNNNKKPWRVRFGYKGKVFSFGRYQTEEEAAKAYRKRKSELKKLSR